MHVCACVHVGWLCVCVCTCRLCVCVYVHVGMWFPQIQLLSQFAFVCILLHSDKDTMRCVTGVCVNVCALPYT